MENAQKILNTIFADLKERLSPTKRRLLKKTTDNLYPSFGAVIWHIQCTYLLPEAARENADVLLAYYKGCTNSFDIAERVLWDFRNLIL